MTAWAVLRLRLPVSVEDTVLHLLDEAGTLGVVVEDGSAPPGSRPAADDPSTEPRPVPDAARTSRPRPAPTARTSQPRSTRDAAQGSLPRTATAYFPAEAELSGLVARLRSLDPALEPTLSKAADERWAERQEASRRPLAIGGRFIIDPGVGAPDGPSDAAGSGVYGSDSGGTDAAGPGADPASGRSPRVRGGRLGRETRSADDPEPHGKSTLRVASAERLRLVIPPGRAFGTGEHETTRLCLELLEALDIEGARVLDLGTGSGILALAAAALGARSVDAVDNDPEAIEIARENLRLNAGTVPARVVTARVGSVEGLEGSYDVVVSNILAGFLESAAMRVASLQAQGSVAILSGFSPAEARSVEEVYRVAGYRLRERREAREWAALALEKVSRAEGEQAPGAGGRGGSGAKGSGRSTRGLKPRGASPGRSKPRGSGPRGARTQGPAGGSTA